MNLKNSGDSTGFEPMTSARGHGFEWVMGHGFESRHGSWVRMTSARGHGFEWVMGSNPVMGHGFESR